MPTYRVEFASTKVTKDLDKIAPKQRQQIVSALETLREYPNVPGCRKLRGYRDIYRLRSGDYRIAFEVKQTRELIVILLIKHRKEIYQKLSTIV
ncbi:hypothetical protein AUK40_01330 [Candidatus Wirthbacteria bacterium CG2_30_54_11]|uniref:Plasmid stabilization protein n=1 Tax=Candidatus Wirthbacteria bacterium CG2_30_54_11 TaxID=1817892 RepID=A0A1J5J241_9BACT|nr:MAG: hypothetical protein AUK40_01330 [Candidatus Wirthbacteria bacterium CG2_30_54_11]